jgi:hypothetical protein
MSHPSVRLPVSNVMQAAADRDIEAGQTLIELERRQDEVLSQLEELDQKLTSILRGLGVTLVEEDDTKQPSIHLANVGDDDSSYEDVAAEDNHQHVASEDLVKPLRRFAA